MTPDEGDGDECTDELLKEHGLLIDRMEAAGAPVSPRSFKNCSPRRSAAFR
jgi:hypothetical protein